MSSKLNSIKQIRLIGMIEGISYLFLLFVSMPLKYIWKMPQAVIMNGWVHGFFICVAGYFDFKNLGSLQMAF